MIPQNHNGFNSDSQKTLLGREGHAQKVAVNRHKVTAYSTKKNYDKKIATWNVRTMFKSLKLENIKQEMKRMNISNIDLSEVG